MPVTRTLPAVTTPPPSTPPGIQKPIDYERLAAKIEDVSLKLDDRWAYFDRAGMLALKPQVGTIVRSIRDVIATHREANGGHVPQPLTDALKSANNAWHDLNGTLPRGEKMYGAPEEAGQTLFGAITGIEAMMVPPAPAGQQELFANLRGPAKPTKLNLG